MTVRLGGEMDVHHGDTVWLTPQEGQIHYFAADGLRME
jgi:multiple sugar transport system ATP-binding protein